MPEISTDQWKYFQEELIPVPIAYHKFFCSILLLYQAVLGNPRILEESFSFLRPLRLREDSGKWIQEMISEKTYRFFSKSLLQIHTSLVWKTLWLKDSFSYKPSSGLLPLGQMEKVGTLTN